TKFVASSPVSGVSASTPLREANAWIDQSLKTDKRRPLFALVHAKAGHPPWIGSDADFENLPPPDYAGLIVARRGGQVLAKERNKRHGNRPLTSEDRIRIDAFARLGLRSDDTQIGQLIETLRQHNVWDSTLLIITSDIASGGSNRVPYGDGESLGEDVLSIPLIIKLPYSRFAGKHVYVPTTVMDITNTIATSMGLHAPEGSQGRDLLEIVAHPTRFPLEPQYAITGNAYSTRWGNYILSGVLPKTPQFCEMTMDQECSTDIASQNPFMASRTWRMTRDHLWNARNKAPILRESATLDPDTIAALTVWGAIEPKPPVKQ
ncbi:MAG: sulfatase-like hydrolase/transferase, partial [Polyangiaceae bacterium]|nr:sulfatase-like hydrolase/transferase [Polyangiaceae bacterium]